MDVVMGICRTGPHNYTTTPPRPRHSNRPTQSRQDLVGVILLARLLDNCVLQPPWFALAAAFTACLPACLLSTCRLLTCSLPVRCQKKYMGFGWALCPLSPLKAAVARHSQPILCDSAALQHHAFCCPATSRIQEIQSYDHLYSAADHFLKKLLHDPEVLTENPYEVGRWSG